MRIGLAQVNPKVGDLVGNQRLILDYIEKAKKEGCDLVAFPEMVITGYPPQDLLYEKSFLKGNKEVLKKVMERTKGIVVVLGFVDYDLEGRIYNAAALIQDGEILQIVHKTLLPTYDVFDEDRYFEPSKSKDIKPSEITIDEKKVSIGIQICEDLWDRKYPIKVTDLLVERGADLVLNISASPFHAGKRFEREEHVREKAIKNKVPLFLVNLVGGQDELVFCGQSVGVDKQGRVVAYGKMFEEELIITDLDVQDGTAPLVEIPEYDREAEIYAALVLGLRDYFRKTGFKRAVLGLSGGIDSSVTACIAADALGAENIVGVSMPSKFSSGHSKSDAETLAENLGIHYIQIPIQEVVDTFHQEMKSAREQIRGLYGVDKSDDDPVADENIQPRVRGNYLMDISNRFRDLKILVLNTGNKTELALGYCTLYGDMTGGVGVIGDVSKLDVYRLAEYVNRRYGREIVPESVIEKRPSAELKEDQYDPFDFDIVSPMVDEIVENRLSRRELIEMGYPPEVVDDVYTRVRRAEYKRWQAPPCIKITKKAFGTGWKMPIVNGFAG